MVNHLDGTDVNSFSSNKQKVQAHSENELKCLHKSVVGNDAKKNESMQLSYQTYRKFILLHKLDEYCRLLCVIVTLVVFSLTMVIPCTLLLFVDYCLVEVMGILPSCFKLNLLIKRTIGHTLLLIAGISLVLESVDSKGVVTSTSNSCNPWSFWSQWYINSRRYADAGINGNTSSSSSADGNKNIRDGEHCEECTTPSSVSGLVCFTHASTLDAFILSAVVPVPSYTYVRAILNNILHHHWSLFVYSLCSISCYCVTGQVRPVHDPLLRVDVGPVWRHLNQPRQPSERRKVSILLCVDIACFNIVIFLFSWYFAPPGPSSQ